MIYLSVLAVEVYLCAAERRCIVVEIRGSGAEGGNVEGAPWLLRWADNSSHLTGLLWRRAFIQARLNPRVFGGGGGGATAEAFLVKSAGFAASPMRAGAASAGFLMDRR